MLGYITREDALAAGLTHEGTLFGVPAWFAGAGENDEGNFMATPKFKPLGIWTLFADSLYDIAECFLPAGRVLESPIRITGEIAP
jgi:hypothetical protein